jgi:hypothetical protein
MTNTLFLMDYNQSLHNQGHGYPCIHAEAWLTFTVDAITDKDQSSSFAAVNQ